MTNFTISPNPVNNNTPFTLNCNHTVPSNVTVVNHIEVKMWDSNAVLISTKQFPGTVYISGQQLNIGIDYSSGINYIGTLDVRLIYDDVMTGTQYRTDYAQLVVN